VKRFELQNERKFRRAQHFVLNDVPGDFRRQRQWESHKLLSLCYYWYGRLNLFGLRIGIGILWGFGWLRSDFA
jgi:hypothetical protein